MWGGGGGGGGVFLDLTDLFFFDAHANQVLPYAHVSSKVTREVGMWCVGVESEVAIRVWLRSIM